jgi:methionyl-tRNA synthetase
MASKEEKFYITTAIDYVNASPHIGHALEKIQSDVLARYHRISSEEVFFLTGTDENSLKNVQAAAEEGIPIKEFIERNTKRFYGLKKSLNLSFDDFIRTTEERHTKGVQKLWQDCKKDIYKKAYRGLYCVGCEEFYKKKELINGLCPEHKTKPELVEEEDYFFRLSRYQDKLKQIIEKKELRIIPETRKNEILSFINSGLEDICISRSAERAKGWGIPVPGDSSQIIWVWFDALANYITALGYADNNAKFKKWWPADLHVIGKGINRFHSIYWPAILLSAGIELPKVIFVHGYLTVAGQKMSKSLGNVIDPFELVEKYGTEPVRYFLLREIPAAEDGDFTYEKFEARYNADLASGLGNLVARVLTVAEKIKPQLIKGEFQNPELTEEINNVRKKYKKFLDEFKFNEALTSIWELISFCDKYIDKKRPWEETENQTAIIADLLYVIGNIAKMLQPFLPETSEKIFQQLGIKPTEEKWHFEIKKGKSLFPRLN